jgi:hypothetical protein
MNSGLEKDRPANFGQIQSCAGKLTNLQDSRRRITSQLQISPTLDAVMVDPNSEKRHLSHKDRCFLHFDAASPAALEL